MTNVPPPASLHVRRYQRCGWSVLELHGEIDLAALPEVYPHVEDATTAPAPRVVIDLTPVTFIDASGLRALVLANSRAGARGGEVRVVCPAGSYTRRVMKMGGVALFLPPADSLDKALSGAEPWPWQAG